MEPNQKKKKFICKFCNKRYPCGKSLGGHIRIHLNGSSTAAEIAEGGDAANMKGPVPEAGAGAGQSGYVLRENPKKTKWFTIDRSNHAFLLAEKVCKECGKGFQSLKALCGHMACHSRNSYFEDHSGTSEKLKELVEDSQSDTETSTPSKRRRSEIMRYKAIGANSSSLSFANGGSVSSASDIEQEQEEVAMCLMMLSRDSGFKGCFSSVADSSDNNSLILESKKNGVKSLYNGNGTFGGKKAKKREVKSIVENNGSEDSGSGYFMNGPGKVESDVSTDGFTKIGELKKGKAELDSRLVDEDFDAELGKRLSRFRRVKTEFGKVLIEKAGYDRAGDRASSKYDSSKRYKNGSYDSEFQGSNAQKQGKSFSLGENITSNRKSNACNVSLNESCENSIDTNYAPRPSNGGKMVKTSSGKSPVEHNFTGNAEKKVGSKKGKMHECPFCSKVFRSGQALGGHKRSHFVGGGGDGTMVIKQEAPETPVPALIDLNLPPAPMEEEANGLVPW